MISWKTSATFCGYELDYLGAPPRSRQRGVCGGRSVQTMPPGFCSRVRSSASSVLILDAGLRLEWPRPHTRRIDAANSNTFCHSIRCERKISAVRINEAWVGDRRTPVLATGLPLCKRTPWPAIASPPSCPTRKARHRECRCVPRVSKPVDIVVVA
jgi:hypothetical protein